jgi:biotin transporter BioY
VHQDVAAVLLTVLIDLVRLAFPLVVALISLIFYLNKKKTGLLLIAVAFFLDAVSVVFLGATALQYLVGIWGSNTWLYGFYQTFVGFFFSVAFTILVVFGIYYVYKEMT